MALGRRKWPPRFAARTPREAHLAWWCGALLCLALVFGAVAALASTSGLIHLSRATPALGAGRSEAESRPPDRVSCDEFGLSDLRSPAEGVWYQSNCVALPLSLAANVTTCNRTSMDEADFTPVAPGLFVTHGGSTSAAYLWYASSESCFDLVSTRAVTAVCTDDTVTFGWTSSVCDAHGGVLAWVNGH